MIKKDYQKPAMRVELLQQQNHLLAGSNLGNVNSNLDPEDELLIDDTPVGFDIWGR